MMINRLSNNLKYIGWWGRYLFWAVMVKSGLLDSYKYIGYRGHSLLRAATKKSSYKDINKTSRTKQESLDLYDEYPPCEMCGTNTVKEVLITKDRRHIVECSHCGLWFTSPRINESRWGEYFREEAERSIITTDNRMKYGRARSDRVKYSAPNWHKRRIARELQNIDEIQGYLGTSIERLHDVGCGVGFLLEAARVKGIEATGNDLNGYACKMMKEKLGLKVCNDILPNLGIKDGSLDAIIFSDYIEHSYHPLEDLKTANKFLRIGGVIWVKTFHVDCLEFERYKGSWEMLGPSHLFHFSTKTLQDMIVKAGFIIENSDSDYNKTIVKVIAIKA